MPPKKDWFQLLLGTSEADSDCDEVSTSADSGAGAETVAGSIPSRDGSDAGSGSGKGSDSASESTPAGDFLDYIRGRASVKSRIQEGPSAESRQIICKELPARVARAAVKSGMPKRRASASAKPKASASAKPKASTKKNLQLAKARTRSAIWFICDHCVLGIASRISCLDVQMWNLSKTSSSHSDGDHLKDSDTHCRTHCKQNEETIN